LEGSSKGWEALKLKSNFMGFGFVEVDDSPFASLELASFDWLPFFPAAVASSSVGCERTLAADFETGDPKEISAAFLALLDWSLFSGASFDSDSATSPLEL
jgi:hypothetical protein